MTRYIRVRRSELTQRQIQVLECVAGGMTNAMIARELRVSEESVKRCLRDLRFILGAADRAHAVDLGWRMGYLGGRQCQK